MIRRGLVVIVSFPGMRCRMEQTDDRRTAPLHYYMRAKQCNTNCKERPS